MNIKSFGQFLLALCVGIICLGSPSHAAAATPAPKVVPLGDNTYSITCVAKNGFHRDTDVLKAQAQDEAAKYCASQGKELRVVSLTAVRPRFAMGYANAKIVFKALAAGDPELTRPIGESGATFVQHTRTDDLYSELTKLDELRKKGILTDEEFQSEKAKVLSRSK